MAFKKLYIFVEGNDDELFFRRVIGPEFINYYDDIEIIQYAQQKKAKIDLLLLSINTLKFDYIVISDIDSAESTGAKKRIIKNRFELVSLDNIIIVITEIESWFLAGLPPEVADYLGLDIIDKTDEITKEDFNTYYIKTYRSRIDFMQEVLKHFSIDIARRRNKSFDFFCQKFFENKLK